MKITTKSGFRWNVDERTLSDWNFISAIAKLESSEKNRRVTAMVGYAEAVLGKNGVEKLVSHIRSKNSGAAPVDAVLKEVAEITNILKANAKVKN